MKNSKQKAEETLVSPNIGNIMLAAAAISSADVEPSRQSITYYEDGSIKTLVFANGFTLEFPPPVEAEKVILKGFNPFWFFSILNSFFYYVKYHIRKSKSCCKCCE